MKGDIIMVNQFENRISGDSPFKPEFEQYVSSHPGRGSLKVQVSAANRSFPVKNVFVEVAVDEGGMRYSLYRDVTNESGIVNEIVLPTCSGSDNNTPATAGRDEAVYLVSVFHPAFEEVVDYPVTVQDRTETILPVALEPLSGDKEDGAWQ